MAIGKGQVLYHLEHSMAVQYKVKQVNWKTWRVRSTDGSKEFTITPEELEREWYFSMEECYEAELGKIEKEIQRLMAPIANDISRLHKEKRKLNMRLNALKRKSPSS